jgi:hypothetical protein
MEGWIKIHRRLLTWEWWDDHNVTRLFIYLLLSANHEDKKWRGIIIKRGQLITSIANLGKSTGLSTKSVRISLNKLKSTNEVASKGANHYTILSICNYDTYQDKESYEGQAEGQANGQTKGKQRANKGQAKGNKQEYKKERNKEIKNITLSTLSFVSPSFLYAWETWVDYKKKLGKPYKTVEGMEGKYNELVALSGDNPEKAMAIVKQSISNEWSGLFQLKRNGSEVIPGEDPVQKQIQRLNELAKERGGL